MVIRRFPYGADLRPTGAVGAGEQPPFEVVPPVRRAPGRCLRSTQPAPGAAASMWHQEQQLGVETQPSSSTREERFSHRARRRTSPRGNGGTPPEHRHAARLSTVPADRPSTGERRIRSRSASSDVSGATSPVTARSVRGRCPCRPTLPRFPNQTRRAPPRPPVSSDDRTREARRRRWPMRRVPSVLPFSAIVICHE